MKKIYLFLLTFCFGLMGYSQSPIATIDRDNINGPTITGTAANISAVGFTKGAGIGTSGPGNDFSTKRWDANSLAAAQLANEYIEWSISANPSFSIDISSLDIRLSRSSNGPVNCQIFYSLDGFATVGIPFSASLSTMTTETDYLVNGPVLNSGDGGTVTFRLYAWNASNTGATLTISGNTTWSDFSIPDPGVRISGIINSGMNSSESVIVATGFNPTDNINYISYNATSGLTTSNAIKIGEFSIRDGGNDFTDSDLLPTILTDLDFNVTGFANIAAMAIFDGAVNVSESTAVSGTTSFNAINSGTGISAPDGGTKTFSIYATFSPTVTDNEQLSFQISNAVANGLAGSTFATSDAGGANTPTSGDDNRIEVTRTKLIFGQEPSNVGLFEVMVPAPTVLGVDVNDNLDLDYTGFILIGSALPIDGASTIVVAANAGVAVFDNLIFSESGTDVLTATPFDAGIAFGISDLFTVLGPTVIIAVQDFDDTNPNWPYTSDITFFDNGWGTDGFYGIINSSVAAPLDFSGFSENILGSHDLNDEGNGTAGLATVTFNTIDISSYSNVNLSFDYDITGYSTNDDAQYEVFYDGVSQGVVDLINGNSDAEGTVNIDIPDIVNTIYLQVSIGNNGNTTFTGFDNFILTAPFDGLIYNNSSWSPSSPTNGTGNVNALVLEGTFTATADFAINNIIVDDNASMIIDKGISIQVNGNLLCNDNVTLDSDSDEYSSLIVEGNVTGSLTYSRHTNINASSGGNGLVSAPATGQTFENFASNNLNLFSNPSNTTEKLFGPFDKTVGLYLTYDTAIPAEASVILEPGVGYRAATSDNDNLDFTGVVTTSAVNVPIIIGGPNNPEWNLVGNPYPSYITLSNFLAANNSQFSTVSSGIYGYDGDASDGWTIWNQAYSDANPDAVITPGQGFLIASGVANGNISFDPSMRTTGTSDDFIPGRSSNSRTAIEHIKIQLSNENQNYFTDFYFTDNASLGLDSGYDSTIFGGVAPNFSIFSHLLEDNVGLDYAVQSLRYSDYADITIPLGINASQNQELTVAIMESTLSESVDVYLDDTTLNTSTLLSAGNYTITPSVNLSGTGRFFLRFSENSLSLDNVVQNELNIFATISPKRLFVKGNLTSLTEVKIVDLQGRLILQSYLEPGNNENKIDITNLKAGIYIVSASNNNLNKTKKIILK